MKRDLEGDTAQGNHNGNSDVQSAKRCPAGTSRIEHFKVATTTTETSKPFVFFVIADPQLGMEATFGMCENWDKELNLLKQAVQEVNRLRPDFVVIAGDLIDEGPAAEREKKSDPEKRKKQITDFKVAIDCVDATIPVFLLPGNHDIGNRPNQETISEYREHFGDDFYTFCYQDVSCLVVNSALWKDASDAVDLQQSHDKWLKDQLKATTCENISPKRRLVFAHDPPFIFDQDEPDGYFNLETNVRHELLSAMSDNGVVAWFCGHYHRNAGGVYKSPSGRKLEVVVTSGVGCAIKNKPGTIPKNAMNKNCIGGADIGDHVSGLRVVRVCREDRKSVV